jgi:light-independent protochlorophyllide reductase subunit B
MGFEGANVLFDTWVHPLVMGLEEHLLTMFRDDFEFHDAAGPSHHGGHAPRPVAPHRIDPDPEAPRGPAAPSAPAVSLASVVPGPVPADTSGAAVAPVSPESIVWLSDAEHELKKIPFFVRGKARRNTEKFAAERGLSAIGLQTLYEAKAHYAR